MCCIFFKIGNTEIAAEYLAGKIGAETIKLIDKTNYKGTIGFLKGGFNASTKKTAEMDSSLFNEISGYERIIS